jgi:hypothetical protein
MIPEVVLHPSSFNGRLYIADRIGTHEKTIILSDDE